MVNLQSGDLTIEVDERTPGVLVATWLGRSNHRNPASVLHPWFDQLFTRAREKAAVLEMRFEDIALEGYQHHPFIKFRVAV